MTKSPGEAGSPNPDSSPPGTSLDAIATRTTPLTALAVGLSSMAFGVWWPFMPLYVLDLGATSDANALFWVAIATGSQGVSRLLTSPIWGMLADRFGRKLMFLRTLYLSSITFIVAAVVQEPWQLALALAIQGIFAGFVGPSIALISVSVPDARLRNSIGKVTGAQYIGGTLGPALGAIMAIAVGFRGSMAAAAFLPLLAGALVHLFVPRDQVNAPKQDPTDGDISRTTSGKLGLEPLRLTFQFMLAVGLFTVLFAMNQLIRFITPIALRAIEGGSNVEALSGLAFSLAGAVSAVSVLVIAPNFFKTGRLRLALGVSCAIAAVGLLFLAIAGSAPLYIGGFLLVALVLSAMVPATNALIAANVTRSRRGTAFGIASSAQAVALLIGPSGAAIFAAISLNLGFGVLAAGMILIGTGLFIFLREPETEAV